jgi:glycosyltransferase involved in cell wall biosynthesis
MPQRKIFFFFPLASVGGTERVHLDVLNALSNYPKEIFIRYRVNPWKGAAFKKHVEGKKEGIQLKSEFEAFGKLTFLSNYLETPRFGRLISAWYIKRLVKKINACSNPIVIFWKRESIDFIWDQLAPHVKIIDIVHNNSNNDSPDAFYLLNDWAPRINHRVLVNAGLMKWITPLYQEQKDAIELMQRISTINHQVTIPTKLPTKPTDVFHVLFVGRDAKEKRVSLFFEIAEHFTQNPRITFHAVGVESSINTPANVTCLGVITSKESIDHVYENAHVLVLTSESEGFPKVISEAMAFGCVPIVTAVGAIPEVLVHGKQAILTNPLKCVDESVHYLNSLLEDYTEYETLSKNAYLYAKEEFDSNRFKNGWKKLIQSLG